MSKVPPRAEQKLLKDYDEADRPISGKALKKKRAPPSVLERVTAGGKREREEQHETVRSKRPKIVDTPIAPVAATPAVPPNALEFLVVATTYHSVVVGLLVRLEAAGSGAARKCVKQEAFASPRHVGCVNCAAVTPKYIVTGGSDERLNIVLWKKGKRAQDAGATVRKGANFSDLGTVASAAEVVAISAFPNDEHHILAGRRDGHLVVLATRTWEPIADSLPIHKKSVNAIAIHPRGFLAVSVGEDRCVCVVDLIKGSVLLRKKTPAGHPPKAVQFSPDGARVAVLLSYAVLVYDVASNFQLIRVFAHEDKMTAVMEDSLAVDKNEAAELSEEDADSVADEDGSNDDDDKEEAVHVKPVRQPRVFVARYPEGEIYAMQWIDNRRILLGREDGSICLADVSVPHTISVPEIAAKTIGGVRVRCITLLVSGALPAAATSEGAASATSGNRTIAVVLTADSQGRCATWDCQLDAKESLTLVQGGDFTVGGRITALTAVPLC